MNDLKRLIEAAKKWQDNVDENDSWGMHADRLYDAISLLGEVEIVEGVVVPMFKSEEPFVRDLPKEWVGKRVAVVLLKEHE